MVDVSDSLTIVPLCPFGPQLAAARPDAAGQAAIDWGERSTQEA